MSDRIVITKLVIPRCRSCNGQAFCNALVNNQTIPLCKNCLRVLSEKIGKKIVLSRSEEQIIPTESTSIYFRSNVELTGKNIKQRPPQEKAVSNFIEYDVFMEYHNDTNYNKELNQYRFYNPDDNRELLVYNTQGKLLYVMDKITGILLRYRLRTDYND